MSRIPKIEYIPGFTYYGTVDSMTVSEGPAGGGILTEDGKYIITEDGKYIIKES
jgi:hypothetical protein